MARIYQFLGKKLVLKHSERGSMQSLCQKQIENVTEKSCKLVLLCHVPANVND